MVYVIAGRAVKSEHIAIGTILIICGHAIYRANKRAALLRAGDPPIHARNPHEEAFIRDKLEAFKRELSRSP
ncbi:uncharacterized protein T551_03264 [Pneumocystis jirovecii RU7]|uniref:Uncharacterized protein n=1 Tax=Pneumocystis jirovecii (strain RU7) TaxID=1408657 RepID=A0A0W4ZEM4_PNEJ7|nr:uncharacterized protein T551_03264 [Pneumocystis jirovecii RU7]KTW26802.1 hypothetical protein T551_03264 [Pneumocystis jirovecii RU7]